MSYLAEGLPQPVPTDLDRPYWEGLRAETILLQRCGDCGAWQWGPEWICHACHSDNRTFEAVTGEARIYSYERVWHPVHPALKAQGPYVVVLVEFPDCQGARVVGNLLGDPEAPVEIGGLVTPVFEHHDDADTPFTLLQWQRGG